jgi:hypothetical protein
VTGSPGQITLKQYYGSFKDFPGMMTYVFTGLPLLSWLAKEVSLENVQRTLFPPLGQIQPLAYSASILFIALTPLLAYFLFKQRITKAALIASSTAALLFFLAYFGFYTAFVRLIDIPTRQTSIAVSIGYARTDFANANFKSESDTDILKARGTEEDQIERLWTIKSIVIVRIALFAAYTLTLVCIVFAISWAVRADLEATQAVK